MTGRRLSVWPPLPPAIHGRRPRALPFPFDRPHRLYSRARHGLWQAVRSSGLSPGDVVLAPAFHHGSEIEALIRAGLEVRFYELDERLAPSGVDDLVDDRVRAFHLTHVLGIPQDARRWRMWADDRDLLLIEDVAQGWPGRAGGQPVGSWGDISIFCVYKTFGVPDGGAVVAPSLPSEPDLGDMGVRRLLRRHASWAISRSSGAARTLTRFQKRHDFSHEADISLGDPSRDALRATRYALPRVFDAQAAERRRANFMYLKNELQDLFSPAFDVDLDEASPFAFPIDVEAKERVDDELIRAGIGPERFWAFAHPALEVERFPDSMRLRRRLLALPVHQELSQPDLERIVEATRRAVRTAHG
jgi:dTDP-4-amino-4,6-dideoxygalactose transaminase